MSTSDDCSTTRLLDVKDFPRDKDVTNKSHRYRVDTLFLRRFWKLLKIMFPSCMSTSVVLFSILILISLIEQFIIYNVGLLPSKFYQSLGVKDLGAFKSIVTTSVLLIMINALVKSLKKYICYVMYVKWRRLICHHIHKRYFIGTVFYQVNNTMTAEIDNVDQRITQDVERFCDQFCQMIPAIVIAPFTIGYYTYQCFIGTGYIGPVSILIYFIITSVINKFLMAPIVNILVKQEKCEGDFRFKHMQIRMHSESIAFFNAGNTECIQTNEFLQKLLFAQQIRINWEFWLNFVVNMFDYIGSILSYIALAIPIFAGVYDNLSPSDLSGLISKNAFVCIYLMSCFSSLIDLSGNLSDTAGYTHRIGQLIGCLNDLQPKSTEGAELEKRAPVRSPGSINAGKDSEPDDDNDDDDKGYSISYTAELVHSCNDDELFRLEHVTYGTPANKLLVSDLTLTLKTRCNILVTGDTGAGKSSLFRVLSGLWTPTSGTVKHQTSLMRFDIFYLPQKPYFSMTSLKQQVMYPLLEMESSCNEHDDRRVLAILQLVELMSLVERCGSINADITWNWYDKLSPGEMQRLSFARLFFHHPKYALLDEATSAVNSDCERILYNECHRKDITLISIGHRESLFKYHDYVLHFNGAGGWKYAPVADINSE